MEKSLHVYVCSTYRDLVSERNGVLEALEELSVQYPSFTYCCSRSILPLDACRLEIRRCDVMVLIVGHLHGVVAPGLDLVHGEAEYLEGRSLGKNIFVYFRDENVGLFPAHFERDPQKKALLESFKEKLRREHDVKIFSGMHALVDMVTLDLSGLAMETGLESQLSGKPAKFRARTGETRAASPAGQTSHGKAEGNQEARTAPLFQKALVTPVRRPRFAFLQKGRALALLLALAAGVGLIALYRLDVIQKIPAWTATPQVASGQVPAQRIVSGDSATGAARSPAQPVETGAVVLTDDTDSSRAFMYKAQAGDKDAQFQMGRMYEEGRGTPRNDTLAFRWYYRAAKQGLADAQYKVAVMQRSGQGAVKSVYRSTLWLQAAAEQGHAKAQFRLGQAYQTGKGVHKNETLAFKWFLKAADQNDPDAQRILTEMKGK